MRQTNQSALKFQKLWSGDSSTYRNTRLSVALGTEVNYAVQIKLMRRVSEAENFKGETHGWAHAVLSPLCHRTISICNGFRYKHDRFVFSTSEKEMVGRLAMKFLPRKQKKSNFRMKNWSMENTQPLLLGIFAWTAGIRW